MSSVLINKVTPESFAAKVLTAGNNKIYIIKSDYYASPMYVFDKDKNRYTEIGNTRMLATTGPKTLSKGETGVYTVATSKDSINVYPCNGSVSISGNTVTYTAPNIDGPYGFVVDGKLVQIEETSA